MHPRLQEIIECLDRELISLRAAVDAVPPEKRIERPAPERWSVAEVLEHLALVESSVLKGCERQLATARAGGLGVETDTSSIVGTLPPEKVARRDRLLVAPERLVPTVNDAEAAWQHVEEVRERFRSFVASCDGLALSQVTMPHPVFGPLNLYQWLLFAAGHHARHAAQIREIGSALGS